MWRRRLLIGWPCVVLGAAILFRVAEAQAYGTNPIVNPGGDVVDAQGTTQVSTSHYYDVTDTATMYGWTVSGSPADPILHNAFQLSAYMGGYYNQADDVTVSAIFRDANGAELGRGSVGPLTVADRDNGTRNSVDYYRAISGAVPPGTRSVRVQMDFTGGSRSLDGYVDNLSLVLNRTVPGDVNGDGCVDDADLANVIFEFGSAESGAFGNTDLNDDGIVDDADLAEVIFNFGSGC